MDDKKKILILAGGTGGHVMPALAVAKKLKAEGHQVHWLGTIDGFEAKIVPKANIPLSIINVNKIRRMTWLQKIVGISSIARALVQSLHFMRQYKPDVVLSMGGYVAGPAGIASWLLGIPLVVHEQNAIPGWTNRILAKFAKQIMVAFPKAGQVLKAKNIIEVGNPVREEIVAIPSPNSRLKSFDDELKILILGGSQGAQSLNAAIPETLSLMKDKKLTIWHQTGALGFASTQESYAKWGLTARVDEFIDNMAEAYAFADIIICRAGALTIAEIACIGVASILIPFPYAVDDHQTFNAKFLSDAKAAFLLPQTQLNPQTLKKLIEQLANHPEQRINMAVASRHLGKPLAAEMVAKQCIEVSGGTI